MFQEIKINKKIYTYSYAWDYSFAVIDAAVEDLKELAVLLESNLFCFDYVKSFGTEHIRLYGDIGSLKTFERRCQNARNY